MQYRIWNPGNKLFLLFQIFYYNKIHWSILHFKWIFIHAWFCNVRHWSFKKLIHCYIECPNVDMFHNMIFKNHICQYYPRYEKFLKYWETVKFIMVYRNFQNSNFCLILKFYHQQQIVLIFALEIMGHLSFKKKFV